MTLKYHQRKEWSSRYYQNWRRKNPEKYLYNAAKRRARDKGLDFDIEVSDIVIPETCPILGFKLKMGDARSKWSSPSLDRKDNTKGYVKGNVFIISMKANLCKSNLSNTDIKALHDYVFGLEQ